MPRGSIRCEPSCSASLALLPTGLLLFLLLAPAALADTQEPVSGEGTYGIADDKVVTNHFFAVILFFPLFVLCMSLSSGGSTSARSSARRSASGSAPTAAGSPAGSRIFTPAAWRCRSAVRREHPPRSDAPGPHPRGVVVSGGVGSAA